MKRDRAHEAIEQKTTQEREADCRLPCPPEPKMHHNGDAKHHAHV